MTKIGCIFAKMAFSVQGGLKVILDIRPYHSLDLINFGHSELGLGYWTCKYTLYQYLKNQRSPQWALVGGSA